MNRTLVVGDIHGGLKALAQLVERAKIKPRDTLIFLGDYVDGWSDSANVISYLIALAKQNTCVFMRGNHDDLTQKWLQTGDLNEVWLQHGGQSTIDAYRNFSKEEIKAHLQFYEQMVDYYIDSKNRLFVHAGFTNLKGPKAEYNSIPFYWDRTLWEMALSIDRRLGPGDSHYPQRFQLFEEIYIGHTPVTRIGITKPYRAANVWNVDTGAAFKGKLSLINVDTKEFVQSDPVFEFYPNENGRN